MFVFVGSIQDALYDEAYVLAKMTHNTIYRSDNCEELNQKLDQVCESKIILCSKPDFIYFSKQKNYSLPYSLPDKTASNLLKFMVTSTLDYPSLFSSEIFSSLTKQRRNRSSGIPFLAIFLEDYNDKEVDSWLSEVS